MSRYYDILLSIAGITGTIFAIVYALVISYIERVASEYAAKYLVYASSNPVHLLSVIYALSLTVLSILFSSIDRFLLDFSCIMALFFVFLTMFLIFLWKIPILLNSNTGIIIPEKYRIMHLIDKRLSMSEKNAKAANVVNMPLRSPLASDIDIFKSELSPIRDIIINAISKNNLQEASDGIIALAEITEYYLERRSKYVRDDDRFVYFIYTEYKIISSYAIKTGYFHLRLHPILAECWEKISLAAIKIRVGWLQNTSLNSLVAFPTEALKDLAIINMPYPDSYTPSMVCKILKNIASEAIKNGYPWQAQNICEALASISLTAMKVAGYSFLSIEANSAILSVSIEIIKNRERLVGKENLNYSIGEIFRSNLATPFITSIKNERQFRLDSPAGFILTNLYDYPGRISLPSAVHALLTYAEKQSVYNSLEIMEIVNRYMLFPSSKELSKSLNFPLVEKAVSTIYLCALMVLATLDKDLRACMFCSDQKVLELPENEVTKLIDEYITMLWWVFDKDERNSYSHDNVLDAIFSILIFCIFGKNDVMKKFAISKTSYLINNYKEKTYTSNDTFFLYCRLFKKIMEDQNIKITEIRIPKYSTKVTHTIDQFPTANKIYPISSHYGLFLNEKDCQWKILGTQEIQNEYFDKINDAIWK